MRERSISPRLADVVEAIEHIRSVLAGVSLENFEADWQKRWLVERGLEIISEASRHFPDDIKSRHPEIPLQKVAGIGNVLRHRAGSVCLNSRLAAAKWISAMVMLQPGLAAAQ